MSAREDADLSDDEDAANRGVDADDEGDPEDADATDIPAQAQQKKREKKLVPPLFGKRSSTQKKNTKNPERNHAQRAQELANQITASLLLRPDCKIEALARVIADLDELERIALRKCGVTQQEHYIAKREVIRDLEKRCFNALHAVDLRANEALPVRVMERIADRLSCDDSGERIVLARPPIYTGAYNPLTRASNRAAGIHDTEKGVLAPRIFPRHQLVVSAMNNVLAGRKLHLAFDFDGAAWDFLQSADDLLKQLDRDANLLPLLNGTLRVLQIIFDGHGWSSKSGAVRFVLRSPHTIRDHNATRNSRDPIFYIGCDKHASLEKAVRIGGLESLWAYFMAGTTITELDVADLPAHVQEDTDFAELACIECVPPPTLHRGGDCAAAHVACALPAPEPRYTQCILCTLPKTEWSCGEDTVR